MIYIKETINGYVKMETNVPIKGDGWIEVPHNLLKDIDEMLPWLYPEFNDEGLLIKVSKKNSNPIIQDSEILNLNTIYSINILEDAINYILMGGDE